MAGTNTETYDSTTVVKKSSSKGQVTMEFEEKQWVVRFPNYQISTKLDKTFRLDYAPMPPTSGP